MTKLTVTSIEDIQAAIYDNEHVHIQGNGTKTGLAYNDCPILDMSQLRGMIEYQPDEYTFTAYAGTPVKDIQAALKENGQYLPCDPLLVEAGATLGGTIAANLSGSRRFRYGGVRDFLLGATVVDGLGRVSRVGSKVVKNAAGFDLAKFLVGSLGQYLLMHDVTFKVFPDKTAFLTYQFDYAKMQEALNAIFYLNRQVFELDALDLEPHRDSCALIARFAGSAQTLAAQVERFATALRQNSKVQTMTQLDDAAYWQGINALKSFEGRSTVVKIPITPRQIPNIADLNGPETQRYSVGGNILWMSDDKLQNLSGILAEMDLTGLKILGRPQYPLYGKPIENTFTERVKAVLDPEHKFQ